MVKFGKSKFKALNKAAKHQKTATGTITNKVLKKKLNAEKKITFQKEVLLKEAVTGGSPLVKSVSAKQVLSDEKAAKKELKAEKETKPRLRPVEKQKKRQKTQISDAKLLLKLMKK